ncbi:zinc-ribbon domain-containing protein [Candidatus Woesearchaeota archaeon]|nr:zinc-ribbon domain-containing protein [Candidatus Woesearchaeota archaeon]
MVKRKPISPLVWLIAGAVLAVMSYFINGRTISGNMEMFFWVGAVFLVYGIIRLIYRRVVGKEKPEKTAAEIPKTIEEMQKAVPTFFCPGCGTRLKDTDAFCPRCGRKISA